VKILIKMIVIKCVTIVFDEEILLKLI